MEQNALQQQQNPQLQGLNQGSNPMEMLQMQQLQQMQQMKQMLGKNQNL